MTFRSSFTTGVAALAFAIGLPEVGSAQIVNTRTVNLLGAGAFNQTFFNVTTAGTFHIYTTSDHDTELWLFQVGNPEAIAFNDDDGVSTADPYNTSDILVNLGVGSYFASSAHYAGELAFDPYTGIGPSFNCYHSSGEGGDDPGCLEDFQFELTNHIDGLEGGILDQVSTTPEPASLVLLGTGLLGVAGLARRRRKV